MVYNCEANDAIYDDLFTHVKRLLTNCLHGKAANNWNNSVTATKYIEYDTRYPFYHGACWCIMNGRIVYACSYKRLLANHLHGKAAELDLANS